jgi:hypothetical protein
MDAHWNAARRSACSAALAGLFYRDDGSAIRGKACP